MKLCLSITGIILAFIVYQLVAALDIMRVTHFHHDTKCQRVPLDLPSEDFADFGEYIIAAPSDSFKLFQHLAIDSIAPGFLVAIHKSTKKVSRIPMLGFPDNLNFLIHGLTLHEKTLYVISHSFTKGGEVLFVFNLDLNNNEVIATYVKKIYISEEHGVYNALSIINENMFYITQWLPFPDNDHGRDHGLLTSLLRDGISLLTKSNPIKVCEAVGEKANCRELEYGHMPNGVVYAENQLYVADSITKEVTIFDVLEGFDIKKSGSVKVDHSIDNLHYRNREMFVAGVDRGVEFLEFIDRASKGKELNIVSGGMSRISMKNGKWISEELIMQKELSLVTTGDVVDGQAILSSVTDPAILFCKLD